jgi:dTDP-4-dehydrorhamnose 3,5-epimerase
MKLIYSPIAGCCRVQLERLEDARGYFQPVFELRELHQVDPSFAVARVNRSFTRPKGAIRGLHFQRSPKAEDKLVQCLRGTIFDVAVDLRPDSPTYLGWVGFELSAENQDMMLVPRGCAHGFQTLTDDCLIEYFLTNDYAPERAGGVRWDDRAFGIAWPLPCTMTSEKDSAWPLLAL